MFEKKSSGYYLRQNMGRNLVSFGRTKTTLPLKVTDMGVALPLKRNSALGIDENLTS